MGIVKTTGNAGIGAGAGGSGTGGAGGASIDDIEQAINAVNTQQALVDQAQNDLAAAEELDDDTVNDSQDALIQANSELAQANATLSAANAAFAHDGALQNQRLDDLENATPVPDAEVAQRLDDLEAGQIAQDDALTVEVTERQTAIISGDTALQTQIDNIVASLPVGQTVAQALATDMAALAAEIGDTNTDFATAFAQLIANRTDIDANTAAHAVNASGLSQEIADRQTADITLQSNIDTETTASVSRDNALQLDIDAKDAQNVKLTGTQTVQGNKTFSNPVLLPATETDTDDLAAVAKQYVDSYKLMSSAQGGEVVKNVASFNAPFGNDHQFTGLIAGADYIIQCTYIWAADSQNSDFWARLSVNGAAVSDHRQEPKDSAGTGTGGTDQRGTATIRVRVTSNTSILTIQAQFRPSLAGVNALIDKTLITIQRVD